MDQSMDQEQPVIVTVTTTKFTIVLGSLYAYQTMLQTLGYPNLDS
jgi:hypothetical protein